MSLIPGQMGSLSRGKLRDSPVVSQWPWTSGIPLMAGRLDDEVAKLRHGDLTGMAVVFLDTIEVRRFFLVNMANTHDT